MRRTTEGELVGSMVDRESE